MTIFFTSHAIWEYHETIPHPLKKYDPTQLHSLSIFLVFVSDYREVSQNLQIWKGWILNEKRFDSCK